jgi:hypothetical protein
MSRLFQTDSYVIDPAPRLERRPDRNDAQAKFAAYMTMFARTLTPTQGTVAVITVEHHIAAESPVTCKIDLKDVDTKPLTLIITRPSTVLPRAALMRLVMFWVHVCGVDFGTTDDSAIVSMIVNSPIAGSADRSVLLHTPLKPPVDLMHMYNALVNKTLVMPLPTQLSVESDYDPLWYKIYPCVIGRGPSAINTSILSLEFFHESGDANFTIELTPYVSGISPAVSVNLSMPPRAPHIPFPKVKHVINLLEAALVALSSSSGEPMSQQEVKYFVGLLTERLL